MGALIKKKQKKTKMQSILTVICLKTSKLRRFNPFSPGILVLYESSQIKAQVRPPQIEFVPGNHMLAKTCA